MKADDLLEEQLEAAMNNFDIKGQKPIDQELDKLKADEEKRPSV